MTMTRAQATKYLLFTALSVLLIWVAVALAVLSLGPSIVQSAYERTMPFGSLNDIIQGQDSHDITHYQRYARAVFFRKTGPPVILFLLALSVGALALATSGVRKRVAALILLNLCVLFLADRIFGRVLHLSRDCGYTRSERAIRLKKFGPNQDTVRDPGESYLAKTDGLSGRAFRLNTDERGFIGPTHLHQNPDRKLFFLGGSTTECIYVSETNRFPYVVGRLVEDATGQRVNSYNGGVSGNNSLHSLNILLNDVLPAEPDVVVLMHNINDLVILLYTGTYWNDNPHRSPIYNTVVRREPPPSFGHLASDTVSWFAPHLAQRIANLTALPTPKVDEWENIRGQRLLYDFPEARAAFRRNLVAFVNLCQAYHATPVLMTQQNRLRPAPDSFVIQRMQKMEKDFGISYAEFQSMYSAFNETVRDVAKSEGVALVDLDVTVPKDRMHIYDTCHLNDHGSIAAARVIADALLLLPLFSNEEQEGEQSPRPYR